MNRGTRNRQVTNPINNDVGSGYAATNWAPAGIENVFEPPATRPAIIFRSTK
jgi:hypothetical protein